MTMAQQQTSDQNPLNNLLAEWQHWLKWFLGDLQGDIGQILHHLHPLLTAPRPSDNGGLLTAPGLETVLQRGNYANLLLSEWMLADSFPDEFLRRAAQHEHLFFAPPPLEDDGGKRVLALFDVGIMQLGLPRVAHIALLMLLSRRAQLLKDEFYWGIVQNEPQWHEFTNVNHLRQMLDVRQVTLITAEQLDKWRNFVDEGDKGDECWFISSQKFHDQGKSLFASHRLSIDETFKATSLEVILHQNGRSAIEIALPLPDEKQCKRLLSAKFIARENGKHPKNNSQKGSRVLADTSLLSPLIISPDGKKVMLRKRGENEAGYIEVDINSSRTKIRNWSVPKGTVIGAAGYSEDGTICLKLKFNKHYEYWSTNKMFPRGKIDFVECSPYSASSQAMEPLMVMLDNKGNGSIARLSNNSATVFVIDALSSPYENSSFSEYGVLNDVLVVQYHSPMQLLYLRQDEDSFFLELSYVGNLASGNLDEVEVYWGYDMGPLQKLGDRFIFAANVNVRQHGLETKFACGMLGQIENKQSLKWLSRTKIGGEQLVETIFPLPMGCKVIGTWFDDALNVLVPVIWDHKKTIGVWRGDRFENWYSDAVKLANAEMCIYSGTIVMHNVDHDIIFFDVNSRQIMAHTGHANGAGKRG